MRATRQALAALQQPADCAALNQQAAEDGAAASVSSRAFCPTLYAYGRAKAAPHLQKLMYVLRLASLSS
eukprot:COSAG04_NODE_5161_length_1717_cov_1.541409_1_plen_68_part_10